MANSIAVTILLDATEVAQGAGGLELQRLRNSNAELARVLPDSSERLQPLFQASLEKS